MSQKYHMVKFFERKKLCRKICQIDKELNELQEEEEEEEEEEERKEKREKLQNERKEYENLLTVRRRISFISLLSFSFSL